MSVCPGGAGLSQIETLARRFAARELSREEWTHEAHLAVGLWHVARYGKAEALTRLREGIRLLNESNGVANTPSGGYHETITRAYVELLDAFIAARGGAEGNLQPLYEALLTGDLARRDALLRFWSKPLLFSAGARAAWLEPDLEPLTDKT